jgi:hypothetical protein
VKVSSGVSRFPAWSLRGVADVRSKAAGSIQVQDNAAV